MCVWCLFCGVQIEVAAALSQLRSSFLYFLLFVGCIDELNPNRGYGFESHWTQYME